jgi:hypothetical protein
MHQGFISRAARAWVSGVLLVTLAMRALVPMGFMPSVERPFTLQLCPDGIPVLLLQSGHDFAHQHGSERAGSGTHHHDLSHTDHCVFAAAAGVGPTSHWSLATPTIEALLGSPFHSATVVIAVQRFRTQQPRAPPTLA